MALLRSYHEATNWYMLVFSLTTTTTTTTTDSMSTQLSGGPQQYIQMYLAVQRPVAETCCCWFVSDEPQRSATVYRKDTNRLSVTPLRISNSFELILNTVTHAHASILHPGTFYDAVLPCDRSHRSRLGSLGRPSFDHSLGGLRRLLRCLYAYIIYDRGSGPNVVVYRCLMRLLFLLSCRWLQRPRTPLCRRRLQRRPRILMLQR